MSQVVHKDHNEAAEAPTPGYLPFAPPSDVITLYDGPLQLRVEEDLSGERPRNVRTVPGTTRRVTCGTARAEALTHPGDVLGPGNFQRPSVVSTV